jgi:transporter family-2 protein
MPHKLTFMPYILLALLLGVFLTVQLGINNTLKAAMNAPIWTAFVSSLVGVSALFIAGLISRTPFPTKVDVPAWAWTGGLLGAVYVVLSIVLVDKIGAATLTGCVVAGQITVSLVLDHFGWLHVPQHPISSGRLAGALLLGLGVWLVKRF